MALRTYSTVSWTVLFHDEFDREFQGLEKDLQDELLAHAKKS